MKLTAFFMMIGCLQLQGAVNSQTVTLAVKDARLEKVFELVEKQTGCVFFYDNKIIKETKAVTISVKNETLPGFLTKLLAAQQLEYSIWHTTITITRTHRIFRGEDVPDTPVENAVPPIKVSGQVTGLNGAPLPGASVRIKGLQEYVLTDNQGKFQIDAEKGATLVITYVGYESVEWKVTGAEAKIDMKPSDKNLDDVEVVINTGYQKIKANEMVGAVEVITDKMLQAQVGTNVLERLRGMTSALQFNNKISPSSASGNPRSVLNMNIRGWSTINGPTDPLIIVNNFPYQGDIDNINPNDVESIVLLKDAAAASIWGTRAGNGVIVINTKRGKFNQKTNISFSSTVTVTDKPDLYRLPLMSTPSYIDFEVEYWRQIGLTSALNDKDPATKVVDVLIDRYKGKITAADSADRINYLKTIDNRQQWDKHIYKNPLTQQYSLNMTGGSSNISWTLAGSYARQNSRTQATNERGTFSFLNTYKVTRKLQLELGLDYAFIKTKTGAPEFNSAGSTNDQITPYNQLVDEQGNAVAAYRKFKKEIADTLGAGLLLDWFYYPYTDWKHDFTTSKQNSYTLNAQLQYKPISDLNIMVAFQTQRQLREENHTRDQLSYFTRDIINSFTALNYTNRTVNRLVPLGDIVTLQNDSRNSFNIRANANYVKQLGQKHRLNLFASFDVSSFVLRKEGQIMVGYSDDPLIHSLVDMVSTRPQLPILPGNVTLPYLLDAFDVYGKKSLQERFISTIFSASYTYNKKYTLYTNLRRDGANILGVRANDRWKPNWAAGINWALSEEKFMKASWINRMALRASVGLLGNVDVSRISRPVASVVQGTPYNYLNIIIPPNPDLRWERTLTANWGLDLSILNNRIALTADYYIKRCRDLYADIAADYTQSPALNLKANASSLNGQGIDIQLTVKNVKAGSFEWTTRFNWSRTTNKIQQHYYQLSDNTASLAAGGDGYTIRETEGVTQASIIFPGQSLYGVSAIRSAGLNNQGQLQWLLNGKPTTKFQDITNDMKLHGANSSSYVYFGSSEPTFAGGINNYFTYKNIGLLVMLDCKFGYYFKKKTVNVVSLTQGYYHKDWELRWQKPGDELHTTVPVFDMTNNFFTYYESYSSDLVKRGDHIRLLNVRLDYAVPLRKKDGAIKNLNIAFNASNMGIIWRANKEKLDPEYDMNYNSYTLQDKMWSLTLAAGF